MSAHEPGFELGTVSVYRRYETTILVTIQSRGSQSLATMDTESKFKNHILLYRLTTHVDEC
jgi:hypothetical protein